MPIQPGLKGHPMHPSLLSVAVTKYSDQKKCGWERAYMAYMP